MHSKSNWQMSYVMQFRVPCFMTHYILHTHPPTYCIVLCMVEFPDYVIWSFFCLVDYWKTYYATYMVWQINSRNGPAKAKFANLCTNGCCRLRNTLLVKLCTSWDDGAIAGNSLENRFPEYLAVTFSRCAGCQKGQQIFVPSGHFLNFGQSQKSQRAKSGE